VTLLWPFYNSRVALPSLKPDVGKTTACHSTSILDAMRANKNRGNAMLFGDNILYDCVCYLILLFCKVAGE